VFEGSAQAAALAAVLSLAADVILLRRRPLNYMVAFVQLTFTLTAVGAAWLAETTGGLVAILALGVATKLLAQLLFERAAPAISGLAEEATGPLVAAHLFVALSLLVLPAYAFLAMRGGFAWFKVSDLRADYTAENSVPLRIVRHWTPILFVWGLFILRGPKGAPRAWKARRTPMAATIVLLMGLQFVAYALLEGSKSAALVLSVIAAGAVQLLGYRLPKRLAIPAALSSVALLVFFLSMVAAEWSASLPEAFGLRMVSGSQGMLFAVEPPEGKYCPVETFWFPVANFLSKLASQPGLTGYSSMGHCLGASDPSVPWELLVPLLAAGYHVAAWSVPAFFIGYLVFALALLRAIAWLCRTTGQVGLAFPVSMLLIWDLLATTTHGKWTNLLVSDLPSVLAFIALAAGLQRAFLGGSARGTASAQPWDGARPPLPPGGNP
jgi:hypothetical protein